MTSERLASWLYWKRAGEEYKPVDICPRCDGWGRYRLPSGEIVYCLCDITRWTWNVKAALDPLRSRVRPATLEEMVQRPEPGHISLDDAKELASIFMKDLSFWLVLSGGYGVGKTHILRSINTYMSPIALYITASDFEQGVFLSLGNDSLQSYVASIARAPVLLFDDYGMEYGAKLMESKVAHLFDFRDRTWEDYPTVVATNLTTEQLSVIPRVGSRLLDTEKSRIAVVGVRDYRLKKR